MGPKRQTQLSYSVSKPYRLVAREFEDQLTGKEDEINVKLDNPDGNFILGPGTTECPKHDLDEEESMCTCVSESMPRIPISRGVLLLIRLNLLKKDGELQKIIEDSTSPPVIPIVTELIRDQKNYTYLRNITVAKEFEIDVELFKLECMKCNVSVSLAISRLINNIMETNPNEHDLIDILTKVHGYQLDYKINVSLGEKL